MEKSARSLTKKFPHIVLVPVQGLLPMQYKAKELAEELGIHSRTLRDWLSQGALHQGRVIPGSALPDAAERTIFDVWMKWRGIRICQVVRELLDISGVDI